MESLLVRSGFSGGEVLLDLSSKDLELDPSQMVSLGLSWIQQRGPQVRVQCLWLVICKDLSVVLSIY